MKSSSRPAALALGAVTIAFVSATAYSAYRSTAVDRDTLQIAHDLAPGIQHLAAGRAALRELQLLAADFTRGGAEPRLLESMRDSRLRMTRELDAYSQLEPHVSGVELAATLRDAIYALEGSLARFLAAAASGDRAAAQLAYATVQPAADETARLGWRALDFAASRSHDLALRIESIHDRGWLMAFVFDGLGILLAGTAWWLIRRTARSEAAVREAHECLLTARADELEQFAARVAHDIVGPLGSVTLALDLVRDCIDDRKLRSVMDRGRAGAFRVQRIVNALLDFARGGARPDPGAAADVREVIEGLVDELRPELETVGAELRVAPFGTGVVRCSPGILTSILSNLLRNALKYVADAETKKITASVLPRGTRVLVQVEDTGPGIPPGSQEVIFEPYRRLDGAKPGLGLGLATVKRLVEAHDGSVGVLAAFHGGSVFWFELPAADPRERAVGPPVQSLPT